MVKAIAEGSGIAHARFFAYMAYSAVVLVPLFVVVTVIFFLNRAPTSAKRSSEP
jgi:hypothetical protein